MKVFRELILILGCYYLGEAISKSLSLPLPGSLIGMLLLFLALLLHIIRLEQVETTSDFLLRHLPFFFIAAGVSLMSSFVEIKHTWFYILMICIITTIVTMGSSALIIQKMMERKKP